MILAGKSLLQSLLIGAKRQESVIHRRVNFGLKAYTMFARSINQTTKTMDGQMMPGLTNLESSTMGVVPCSYLGTTTTASSRTFSHQVLITVKWNF